MTRYNPKAIEPKWQQVWADTKLYQAVDFDPRPKYYMLTEFPYPSGDGLHSGHAREYTLGDVMARYRRMQGYNVLFPMGYDAFGLPTENYAIKNKMTPQAATAKNVATFRQQLTSLGYSIDWDREVNTSNPSYYKWTQWLFLQFLKAGLAYQAETAINWCPKCKTGLANEEVVDGKHERCGTPVEKKLLKQWNLRITQYADRLVEGLKTVDFPDRIASQQVNWIGRSEGAEIDFEAVEEKLTVYTTRPDTLGGATFLVVAPEHPAVAALTSDEQRPAVEAYVKKVQGESEVARQETDRPKTGVWTGATAKNPLTGRDMPVWVADYVLAGYGTGAIMAVPAHDDRDFAFAKAFDLPLQPVIEPVTGTPHGDDHEKEAIVAVVHDAKTNKTLMLDWGPRRQNWGGMLFVGGGVDEHEDLVEAAQREIAEETGYQHVKFIRQTEVPVRNYYYSNVKDRHDMARMHGLLFELVDEDQVELKLDEGEKNKFTPRWVDDNAVFSTVSDEGHELIYRMLMREEAFPGEGVLVNSGQFDGLAGIEAKRAITKWLYDQGLGRGATKFKLRDWIFSRQHYWGEPIPIIHCAHCAAQELKPKLSVNFYVQAIWDALEAGVKTVESRVLNPDEPDRYFGNVTVGDVVNFHHKATGEDKLYEVTEVYRYHDLDELYADTEVATRVMSTGKLPPKPEFIEGYRQLAPDYLERIQTHGLVAWRVRPAAKAVPVPEDQLPVELPAIDHYEPTDDGQSPLAAVTEWVNTACPDCGGPAKRETDTMPNWAGSNWYYLRYMDARNDQAFADHTKLNYWSPVDLYLGGMEHTTLHLLYSRFCHQVLYDQGLVPTPEPYAARRGQGIVLAADGRKMSKSLGNVVNPTDIIAQYGADALRLYVMFMAPYDESTAWSDERLGGVSRFLYRVWGLAHELIANKAAPAGEAATGTGEIEAAVDRMTHKTLQKIHHGLHDMRFNTTVSALMEYVNFLNEPAMKAHLTASAYAPLAQRTVRTLVLMLAPSAPHLAEELWHQLGEESSVHVAVWPQYDPALIRDELVTIAVQVNGKLRGTVVAAADLAEVEVVELAQAEPNVAKHLEGVTVIKTIVVPRKLINFVVK